MDNGHPAWTARPPEAAGPADRLSASAAAAALGVSQRTVRRAIARGDLPAVKRGGVYRIAPADLAAFGALRPHAPPPTRSGLAGSVLVPFPAREAVAVSALPSWRTPLIGREAEVAALVDLLGGGGASLVTLRGAGGVGKSRFAVQAAADAARRSPTASGSCRSPRSAIRPSSRQRSCARWGRSSRRTERRWRP